MVSLLGMTYNLVNLNILDITMKSTLSVLSKFSLTFLVISCVGCGFSEPRRVQNDFGNSVRQMVKEQIHDPATASQPLLNAPDILDGISADNSVDAYQTGKKPSSAGSSAAP